MIFYFSLITFIIFLLYYILFFINIFFNDIFLYFYFILGLWLRGWRRVGYFDKITFLFSQKIYFSNKWFVLLFLIFVGISIILADFYHSKRPKWKGSESETLIIIHWTENIFLVGSESQKTKPNSTKGTYIFSYGMSRRVDNVTHCWGFYEITELRQWLNPW